MYVDIVAQVCLGGRGAGGACMCILLPRYVKVGEGQVVHVHACKCFSTPSPAPNPVK
jgi:hypothetical protein